MRKRNADSIHVSIRFKNDADRNMAAEAELLMSLLPQLMAAIVAEAQVNDESISVEKLSLQQKNNLTLDNDVRSNKDVR
jgi:hypothetical protein